MRVMFVQLSDIHVKSEDDGVLRRAEAIAGAVRSMAHSLDLCILTLTGDLTFSGSEEEYLAVTAFIGRVRDRIQGDLGAATPVTCAMIPGNHDCDFSTHLASRDLLLEALLKTPAMSIDDSIITTCSQVQDHFFMLRDRHDGGLHHVSRLYYEYRYTVGEDSLLIRCVNTAWMSQIRETPGSLLVPLSALPHDSTTPTLAVTLMHHPYNWLFPENARAFRKVIEKTSDIIFSGHEHDFTHREIDSSTGEHNQYIEAAALQESADPDLSAFNILIVDTSTRKQALTTFQWDGELYASTGSAEEWEDYQVNRLRVRALFDHSTDFLEELDDPGIALNHTIKGKVTLSDVFVYPDLVETNYLQRDNTKIVNARRLLSARPRQERILITGAEKSGKSCLARALVRAVHADGLIPVLLDGTRLTSGNEKAVHRHIETAFAHQYDKCQLSRYR